MAFIDEIERYKELTNQTEALKEKVKNVALNKGLEVVENVDTMDSVLDKLDSLEVGGGEPILQEKTVTENGLVTPDEGYDGLSQVEVNVQPILQEKIATENGDVLPDEGYDGLSKVTVNVASTGGIDRLQWKCDNIKSLHREFANYEGESLDEVLVGLDTINVKDVSYMFHSCLTLKSVLLFNTINVKDMSYMFYNCMYINQIPLYDTQNVTSMNNMFSMCRSIITIPQINTSKVTTMSSMFNQASIQEMPKIDTSKVINMGSMFSNCSGLHTIHSIDMFSVESASSMFNRCTNLENLTLKNIKINITIGSGTSYGTKLTVNSLVNTIKELWDYSSGTTTYTLTMGTSNTPKLTDVYVKLITPTAEQIAADPYIESKMPCEVCASTDEGAMLITDYATLKKWTIA